MTETEKVPVQVGEKEIEQPATSREWGLLQNVRKEIDRLFEDFNLRSWRLRSLVARRDRATLARLHELGLRTLR